jgi:hypothetical protein
LRANSAVREREREMMKESSPSDKQPILMASAKEIKKNLHQIFNESIKLKSLEKKELKRSLAENIIFESSIPILSSVLIEKRLRFALKWKQWKPRKIKLSHKGNACIIPHTTYS